MREINKIRIALVISSFISLLFIFNNDVFAKRGYDAEKEKVDSTFMKSSKWPQVLQDFLRYELIYGDHKIDHLEAKYLVNASFQLQSQTDANGIAGRIQAIALLMTVLPAETNAIDACVSAIQSKTNYSKELCQKQLEEEIQKNLSSINEIKTLCHEIVSKGGNVTINQENVSDWLFYQLLKTSGITTAIYSRFIIDNKLEINDVLESLKFASQPDEYVLSLAEFILKDSTLARKRVKLAELSGYMNVSDGKKLIDMLYNSIPHTIDDKGNVTYRYRNPGPDSELSGPLGYALRHIMFREEYIKAKKDGKLLDFFAVQTLPGKQKEDKSWLLYRYHPELIKQLSEIYNNNNTSAEIKGELKVVLSGVVRYGEIFKEYTQYLPYIESLK